MKGWRFFFAVHIIACSFLATAPPPLLAQEHQHYRRLANLSSFEPIVMDAENLYWSDSGFLWKLQKQDGEVQRLGPGISCCQIVYDSGYIYWISLGDIGRVSTNKAKAETIVSGLRDSRFIAIGPTYIAWVTDGYGKPEGGFVQTVSRSGGRTVATIAGNQRTSNFGGIAADGDVIYWIESLTGYVMRMAIGEKGPTVLCRQCAGEELLQDKDYLYSIREQSIVQIDKHRGNFKTLYQAPRRPYMSIDSIAVDSDYVYFTSWSKRDQATGVIGRLSKAGGKAQIIETSLNAPNYIIVDSKSVYFVDYNPNSKGAFVGAVTKPQ